MQDQLPTQAKAVRVAGIPFLCTTPSEAVQWTLDVAGAGSGGIAIRLANAYCVALAQSDAAYRQLLTGDGVNLPDGMPVKWAMRVSRDGRRAQRVRGPSFFRDVIRNGTGTRHFFLGSVPSVMVDMLQRLEQDSPGISIAGTYCPPMAPLDSEFLEACERQVSASGAEIIWIGLGTPKQDFVADYLQRRTGKVCIGVGAAFDFVAGSVREAPQWVQLSGFEWLYRFASEPKRLWKRYIFGNSIFVMSVIKHLVRSRAS